eukprot:CAMPEP_0172439412 /NCGR_PEP_ID=MMETSP1065-20121228/413_1 /TAXON_ID=265537 /ORGANISM="Amphiprora paludosa, Strain CCMP125" /LENGTH=257 /DNA_ID=CAMNT_0013188093 /DNA_START=41 /DNA_END=814 /DNA_ORIENTATION=-
MGNSIARDFKKVQLDQAGAMSEGLSEEMIAPGSVTLKNPMTVVIRRDHNRKGSIIVFDLGSMLPLYVTKKKRDKKSELESVTKDRQGKVLFLTTAPSKGKRLIYKAPKNTPSKIRSTSPPTVAPVVDGESGLDSSSTHSSSSFTSITSNTSSSSSSWRYSKSDLPCSAQIDIDRSGSSSKAFLSVVVWKGSGPELRQVYKAVQIPQVKYGSLVVDNEGHVVGKSCLDEQRMEPKIQIAAGADVPSVVALATTLLGDF